MKKHIFPRLSFDMACYAYSVLTRWFSSVYSGAGREPSLDQVVKQVVIASSVTYREVNASDQSHLPETTHDIPDIVQLINRKERDTDKVIIIPDHMVLLSAQDQLKIWITH